MFEVATIWAEMQVIKVMFEVAEFLEVEKKKIKKMVVVGVESSIYRRPALSRREFTFSYFISPLSLYELAHPP